MNLDELRSVQSTERRKDSLQNLRPSFYQEVGEYIADLEAERDRVADDADDPFSSPEVSRLTDEIETAKDVVEAVYERRMGKLVKQASLAAAGMPADDEGLTAEERRLFEDLVDRIEANKGHVLSVLEGDGAADDGESQAGPDAVEGTEPEGATVGPADQASRSRDGTGSPDAQPAPPEATDPERAGPAASGDDPSEIDVSAADAMGETPGSGSTATEADDRPSPEPTPDPEGDVDPLDGRDEAGVGTDPESGGDPAPEGDESGPDVDRLTVRITRDVGSILGVDDREYTLASDDVVTLPEENATPLVERDAAEPLE